MELQTLKDFEELKSNVGRVQKSGENPHFGNKHITLGALQEIVKEKVKASKFITYIQKGVEISGENFLELSFYHENGDVITGLYKLIVSRQDPQMLGSAITYMRRYSLTSMLDIEEVDDDGNMASGKGKTFDDSSLIGKLERCKTTDSLLKTWESLTKLQRNKQTLIDVKDKMKLKVSEKSKN